MEREEREPSIEGPRTNSRGRGVIPITFLVIVATALLYGLSGAPVAKGLEIGNKLRADAKVLLVVNFSELVRRPLAYARAWPDQCSPGDLRDDITTLTDGAYPNDVDLGGISAHAVIDSLSRNWPALHLSQVGLWGPE